jgi:tetratricopeptide (TPR) repeat protein
VPEEDEMRHFHKVPLFTAFVLILLMQSNEISPTQTLVKDHIFQGLKERFGFEIPITEEFLNEHAFHGLRRHDAPDEAIVLFRFCLSLYPESSEAHEGIGEAYARKGMTEKAIESYHRALELNPASTNAKNKLDELKKRIR